ncbi:translesion error-prone DNA polymerase V autoproteolytic subunit [bacterium]|jgi:DNA polymerase V|nr:translesion error-prone DNA polymerase V autoproteolytic subunit [bacterium]MBT6293236.1 translesion error-prone DNA polymerase V autoproteolytic subunit [bacterium]
MNIKLPLLTSCVSAGFPSPADDYIEDNLDLNKFLIKQKDSTFFMKVEGDSMKDLGIFSDNILIIDRSIKVFEHKVVVVVLNGEFTVRTFVKKQGRVFLVPGNKKYKVIEIVEGMDFEVWGVVTTVLNKFKS